MPLTLGLSLGALAAAQLVVGVALQFVVLVVVGAGAATDAFVAAQTVPMLVFGIFALPLQNIWLPRLSVLANDLSEWRRAQGVAQGQLLLLVGGAAIVLACTAGWWIRLVFPGLNDAQAQLAVRITQILLFAALLNGQAALLTVALRARDRFVAPELVLLVVGVIAVAATVIVVPQHGVLGAAWVNAARSAAVVAILYVLANRPAPALFAAARDAASWRRVRPLLAGSSVYKCEPLVDRFWASQAAAGGLTIFTLSQTGIGAIAQVLERSVCMPLVPRLARLAEAKDFAGMRSLYRRCVVRVGTFVGVCLLLLLLGWPAWDVAMQAAFKLSEEAAQQMWWVCVMLLGFLHVAAAGAVPVAAFYALGDTRTPVKLSIASFIAGIALKSAGFLWLGLPGLAIATSAYYVGNMFVIAIFLERRLDDAARGPR